MIKIKVVVATRKNKVDFFSQTLTGKSLMHQIDASRIKLTLFDCNTTGLSKLYNRAIDESEHETPCIMVFMHDDLLILDYDWIRRIEEGLKNFDILGIVGNKKRYPKQSSWAYKDAECTIQENNEFASGHIGFGQQYPPNYIGIYGPTPAKVILLDGLMICVRSDTLHHNKIRFDERFDFHFYDMDFSRQAEAIGLSCGTWPISLVHDSLGAVNTPSWTRGYQTYLAKWGE